MGLTELPRINEVAYFLQRFSPEVRAELESNRPDLVPLLAAEMEGGVADRIDEAALRHGLSARAEVLSAALEPAISRCAPAVSSINERLSRARRFRFISAVLATIGASSVIGAAFMGKVETLIAGGLTLASNIAALFANTVILGRQDREAELTATARRLVKASGQAELSRTMLSALTRTQFDVDEMRALLKESNELFAEISDALSTVES